MKYGHLVLAGLIWAALCLGLPALAETLNGLKPGGSPLGLALMAEGAPVLLVVAAALLSRTPKPPTTATKERPAQ